MAPLESVVKKWEICICQQINPCNHYSVKFEQCSATLRLQEMT